MKNKKCRDSKKTIFLIKLNFINSTVPVDLDLTKRAQLLSTV